MSTCVPAPPVFWSLGAAAVQVAYPPLVPRQSPQCIIVQLQAALHCTLLQVVL